MVGGMVAFLWGTATSLVASLWGVVTGLSLVHWTLLLSLLVLSIYYLVQAPFSKFPSLPRHPRPTHWLWGNKSAPGVESSVQHIIDYYKDMKHHRFSLYFEGRNPCLIITDLELVKKIMVTDFDHFEDLGFVDQRYRKEVGLVFGLADTYGEEWRSLKRLVGPAFSGPRVKKTVPAINQAGDKMVAHLKKSLAMGEEVSLVPTVMKFAMTTIGSVVFGIDINCYEEKENEFIKNGNKIINVYRFLAMDVVPDLMRLFGIKLIDPPAEKFFTDIGQSIVKQRMNSLVEHNDIVQGLLRAAKEEPDKMTPSMMFQTIVQFFTDGYFSYNEVFSSILFLVAGHPEVQERLREEVDTVVGDSQLTEELLRELPYLEQVVSEGLRRLPIPATSRFCTKEYRIPGSDFTVPKGMKVIIPIAGIQLDPCYWPNPTSFQPDRFSLENKASHKNGSFMPFGFGPKQCIGFNLMKTEAKVMFCHLIRNCRLDLPGPLEQEITYDPMSFLSPNGVNNVKILQRD